MSHIKGCQSSKPPALSSCPDKVCSVLFQLESLQLSFQMGKPCLFLLIFVHFKSRQNTLELKNKNGPSFQIPHAEIIFVSVGVVFQVHDLSFKFFDFLCFFSVLHDQIADHLLEFSVLKMELADEFHVQVFKSSINHFAKLLNRR